MINPRLLLGFGLLYGLAVVATGVVVSAWVVGLLWLCWLYRWYALVGASRTFSAFLPKYSRVGLVLRTQNLPTQQRWDGLSIWKGRIKRIAYSSAALSLFSSPVWDARDYSESWKILSSIRAQVPDPSSLPTFPNCEGYGCKALQEARDSVINGGDGIESNGDEWPLNYWPITSLGNSVTDGAGTLNDILINDCTDDAYDIIVPQVSGTPSAAGSSLSAGDITCKHWYLAGQGAPGDGFYLYVDDSDETPTLILGTSASFDPATDFAIRYIGLWHDSVPSGNNGDALNVYCPSRAVFNHMEIMGGADQTQTITCGRGGTMEDVTFSYNLRHEFTNQPTTCLFTIGVAATKGIAHRVDFNNGVDIHIGHRSQPCNTNQPNGEDMDRDTIYQLVAINNCSYGQANFAMNIQAMIALFYAERNCWVGAGDDDDMYRTGTNLSDGSGGNTDSVPWMINWVANHVDDGGSPCDSTGDWYDDCFHEVDGSTPVAYAGHTTTDPPTEPDFDWTPVSAMQAWTNNVLGRVAGIDVLRDCDGTTRDARNALSDSLYDDAENGTTDMEESTNVWPSIGTSPSACTDTDSDGMPDEFEDLYGLDKTDATDNVTVDPSTGYLAIEMYLNSGEFNTATGDTGPTGNARLPRDYWPFFLNMMLAWLVFMVAQAGGYAYADRRRYA